MKKFFNDCKVTVLGAVTGLALLVGCSSEAQTTDGYASRQDNNPLTNYTEVVFVGSPTKSIVLKSIDYRSDTNTAHLHFYAGTTPFTVTGIINNTQLVVSANSGIITNQLCLIQYGSTQLWSALVLYTNQLTNIFLAGGSTLGLTIPTNAVLWNTTNRHLRKIDVTSGNLAGEALFAAQTRAPLAVRIDPGVVTSNRLSATVLYQTQ